MFNKPNSAGPRYRQSGLNPINEEFMDILKKKYPKYSHLTKPQVHKIIVAFNKQVCENIIEFRDGIELPEYIGLMFIGTCKARKKANPNYHLSAEFNRMLENRNWESDNNLAKIFFTPVNRSKNAFANRELWGLNPARWFKTKVGHTYPYLWKRYVEVDPHKKLSYVLRNGKYRMEKIDEEENIVKNLKPYSEFDLD
jgi:hypothetical protein